MNVKKLYRSRTDRLIAGVFGGMGEYFGVDPTLLRLGWVVVTIVSAILPGIAIYAVAVIIVPLEPGTPEVANPASNANAGTPPTETPSASNSDRDAVIQRSW